MGVVRLPTAFGRYRVVSTIAEGGMGVVYRALDPDSGDAVAVKTVVGARAVNLTCLRREIYALGRVGHPGIVRIREQGITDGVPWYAMDLIEGTPLRCLLDGTVAEATRTAGVRRAVRDVEPLRGERRAEFIAIIRRLCPPLGSLHDEGIVHRDLKPENIVLRPDGSPVIVDFGLASQLGSAAREAISAAAHAELGTLGYMAPEQRRGELHDARADIYALGCMLYEALTGRLPLYAAGRPSAHCDDIEPALDELVARLVADDPRERLGYVDDVARALDRILGSESPRVHRGRTYLYRPALAGREDSLARLGSWLDSVRGGLALVGGESGVGKTRLMMELARTLARRQVRVITGECTPVEGAAPLHPLRPLLLAIADHCRVGGAAHAERILGRRARVLGAIEPALLAFARPDHPELEPLAPQSARARLFADLGDAVAELARDEPLVILVDDLQWVDELTATFLAQNAQSLRLWGVHVIGTYRSEAVEPALESIRRAADLALEVGRLTGSAVSAMVSTMLAIAEPPPSLVELMHGRSEGNPLFVAEYLRAAVERGWLERDAAGVWRVLGENAGSVPLPPSLRELVTQRIDGVSSAAARFVEAAAVLGRELDTTATAAMLSLDDASEFRILDELLRRQVLEQVTADRLRFSHDTLREVACERIPPVRRRELHRAAAHVLDNLHRGDASYAGVLAHHCLEAEDHHGAIDHLERAGEHAISAAAHGQARQFFGKALALPVSVAPLRRSRWMRRIAEAAFGQGDIEQSEAHATETLATLTGRLPSSRIGWVALSARAVASRLLFHTRVAPSETARAASLEAALTAGQLASTYYFTGDALRMIGTLLLGVNLADRAGSPAAVIESFARLGYVAGVGGLHPTARHYFSRASALAAGQTSSGALALYLHAFYHLGLAQWADAEQKGDRAVQLLLANGDRQDAEIAQTIAGHAVYFSGRISDARRRYAQVLESARSRGNIQHEAWGWYLVGRSDLALGETSAAVAALERARNQLADVADRFSSVMCYGLLAQTYLVQRDLDAAEHVARALQPQLTGVLPLAPCVHGYVGAADVYLALASRDPRHKRTARRSARQLARFARVFPMARAAMYRISARCDILDGDLVAAIRKLRRSVATAEQHAMPIDAALAHTLLSRIEPSRERAQAHATHADALFARLEMRSDAVTC